MYYSAIETHEEFLVLRCKVSVKLYLIFRKPDEVNDCQVVSLHITQLYKHNHGGVFFSLLSQNISR